MYDFILVCNELSFLQNKQNQILENSEWRAFIYNCVRCKLCHRFFFLLKASILACLIQSFQNNKYLNERSKICFTQFVRYLGLSISVPVYLCICFVYKGGNNRNLFNKYLVGTCLIYKETKLVILAHASLE